MSGMLYGYGYFQPAQNFLFFYPFPYLGIHLMMLHITDPTVHGYLLPYHVRQPKHIQSSSYLVAARSTCLVPWKMDSYIGTSISNTHPLPTPQSLKYTTAEGLIHTGFWWAYNPFQNSFTEFQSDKIPPKGSHHPFTSVTYEPENNPPYLL